MRAGSLRHKVKLQQVTVTPDPTTGAPANTWADISNPNVFAAVEPLSGREYHEARSRNSEVDTRIRIRYRSGIAAKMRVLWGSRTFDIKAVLNLEERNRELHLMCKEYTDGR